ncbi:hypothetical protein CW368_04245 [Actinomycetales bacterium SN12]|nr:hypothetical protein CW368_04245 [Actinomycetales bacterium SN12]
MTENPARPTRSRTRRRVAWTAGIVAAVLLLAAGWVVARGAAAAGELQKVEKTASELRAAVASGDLDGAARDAHVLSQHAGAARDLTGDPIWRAFEVIPWAGSNLTAVREVSQIAADIADRGLPPLLTAAESIDPARFAITDGTIDLALFTEAQEPLAEAADVLARAAARADRIDVDATIPRLGEAIGQLRDAVDESAQIVDALHSASVLVPPMLGADGPRSYVIAMQNNAELRSSGGIIGAIALVRAENGRITIQQQASTTDFPELSTPLPLSEPTVALFDDRPGRYLQNITSIPDFAEAGPVIAARWQNRFGTPVDGVIAVDALVTQKLMAATGPLTFGPFTATEHNVVSLLLSEIYAAVPDPAVQDQIFAEAATTLLSAAFNASDPKQLLAALVGSADEGRVRIWSSHDDEENLLITSTLGGALPEDSASAHHVGVLFNDATGAKMDYYTGAVITTAVGMCEGTPTTRVRVTWKNDAPSDAAASLPAYVTGDGTYGVQPGSVRTLIAIYGPDGAVPSHTRADGGDASAQTAVLGQHFAVQHEVLLAPGESATIEVDFEGRGAGARNTEVVHTPMIRAPKITTEQLRCAS